MSELTFPTEFCFKVIGRRTDDFEAFVVMTMRKHFPDLSESAVTGRESRGHHYLALTVRVHALSQEQLDAAYRELSSDPRVLFSL